MKKQSIFIINNLWWLIPLLIVLLFWNHMAPILLMLIFAYIGRIILNPFILFIEKYIGSRKWSVFIVVILLIIVAFILSKTFFPLISNQILAFQSYLTMETFVKLLNRIKMILINIIPSYMFNIFNDFLNQFNSEFSEIWATGLSQIRSFISSAGTIAFALGSAFLSLLIIIVFMIIFLLEGKKFSQAFLNAVPNEHYGMAKRMLSKTSSQIHAYIRGQLIVSTLVAITSIIGLFTLQWLTNVSIPYTILIGIIAGLFNLIPFAGPIMGMIPAIIMYLITDQVIPIHFFYILLIIITFSIVQIMDNLFFSPYIMGESVGLHPILVIILVLFGASIGGIIGMILAVPIAAIIKVISVELVHSLKK